MARILILEDDQPTADVLGDLLRTEGHQVSAVGDRLTGAIEIGGGLYDLVLSDLKVPPSSSPGETLLWLQDCARTVPIILMTAAVEARQWEAGRLGFAAIIFKPFDLDELLATIASVPLPSVVS